MTPVIPSRWAIFDNWNLNNVPGLQVYAITPPGQATRTLNNFAVARQNRSKTGSAYYQKNVIQVSVYIVRPTHELAEAAVDTLYQNIQDVEGSLILPMSGTARQYTATYEATTINNAIPNTNTFPGGVADLTLTFECSDSFGYDTGYTLLDNRTGLTSSSIATQYTQGGGAKYQVPFIQIKYTTAPTGAAGGTVTIGLASTGQQIQITRPIWSQYDLIQIDLRNKQVLVNGVEVDFTGPLFEVPLGLQDITYSDNFTTRTLNWYVYVYNRWN